MRFEDKLNLRYIFKKQNRDQSRKTHFATCNLNSSANASLNKNVLIQISICTMRNIDLEKNTITKIQLFFNGGLVKTRKIVFIFK